MNSSKAPTILAWRLRNLPVILLILFALFVRGGILFMSLESFDADPDSYEKLAINWYEYGVLGEGEQATAFRPPLYPWILKELIHLQHPSQCRVNKFEINKIDGSTNSVVNRKFSLLRKFVNENLTLSRNASIAFLHWILGVSTVIFAYKLGRLAHLPKTWSCFVGVLVTVDPLLLQQSRLIMTETLAAFLAAALLLGCVVCSRQHNNRANWFFFLLGILFGLSALCRPTFFIFAGLTFITFIILGIKNSRKYTFIHTAFLLVGIACTTAPWFARNLHEFKLPILATTHGGYTLYLANNPEIYEHYRSEPFFSYWDPENFHQQHKSAYEVALNRTNLRPNTKEAELFQNEWTKQKALETIQSSPKTFLYSCVVRFCELWRITPNSVALIPPKGNTFSNKIVLYKSYMRTIIAIFYLWEFFFALIFVIHQLIFNRNYNTFPNTKNKDKAPPQAVGSTPLVWGAAFILSIQIPHFIYWTNMRMRTPLEVFIPILAVLGIFTLKTKISQKREYDK